MNYNELLALATLLIDEKIGEIKTIQGKKGVRGPKGNDGESFSWSCHKEEIFQKINEARLKFSDLTEDEFESLRGANGLKGKNGRDGKDGLDGEKGTDGKDFNWYEHKDEIFQKVIETKLTFSDLDNKEKNELRGEKGPRGQRGRPGLPGKNGEKLTWGDCKDEILSEIENNKLTFSQLTEEDKKELRGDRGLRGYKGLRGIDGKDGFSFDWNDHKEKIINQIEKNRFKYEDLTCEQKEELKGARGQRGSKGKSGENGLDAFEIWSDYNEGTREDFINSLKGKTGIPGIRGIQGTRGEKGDKGIQGQAGEDAVFIVDVFINESNGKFSFVFVFNNGRRLETKEIDKPRFEQITSQTIISSGNGSGGVTLKTFKDGVELGDTENLDFIGDNITTTYNSLTKTTQVSVNDSCVVVLDEGTEVTDCLKSINFIGDLVEVVNSTKMSDWATLTDVEPSMAAYSAGNFGNIDVIISEPDPSNVIIKGVTCLTSVYVGAAVVMTNLEVAINGLADDAATSNIIGICETKNTTTNCDIRVLGVTSPIYIGLDTTKTYYLSDTIPGGIIPNLPSIGNFRVKIGKPFSGTKILTQVGEVEQITL